MAVSKKLHKYSVAESLNSETATGWTELARATTDNNAEVNTALTNGHTVLYIYALEQCAVVFDAQSGNACGNNSIRIPEDTLVKFNIPNGATYVHVKGDVGSSSGKYAYMVTG